MLNCLNYAHRKSAICCRTHRRSAVAHGSQYPHVVAHMVYQWIRPLLGADVDDAQDLYLIKDGAAANSW